MAMEIVHVEETLMFREWMLRIMLLHCCGDAGATLFGLAKSKPKISLRERTINRREIDVVISCRGKRICVELKRSDIYRAIDQAVGYLDSGACDYAYVAIDLAIDTILDILRTSYSLAEKVFRNGIGIASTYSNAIVFRAFKRKDASSKYLTLMEFLSGKGS